MFLFDHLINPGFGKQKPKVEIVNERDALDE